uniref:T cell receptor beta variable 23-1 (non-functional) n=1 Tax=Otolemur garnettii TaxID=30611 RepID=H0XUT7_OTOGA
MGTRLVCCAAFCLLAAGSFEAKVTQTPGHLVKGIGQKAKMDCIPQEGHNFLYWYQLSQNKELQFLISFQFKRIFDQTEMYKERFSAECPSDSPCSLEIPSPQPGDSALYFCASS